MVCGVALQELNMQDGSKDGSRAAYEIHTAFEDISGSWNYQVNFQF
jgi:hypothetical protein